LNKEAAFLYRRWLFCFNRDKKTEKLFFLHYHYNISSIILIFEFKMKFKNPSFYKLEYIFKHLLWFFDNLYTKVLKET